MKKNKIILLIIVLSIVVTLSTILVLAIRDNNIQVDEMVVLCDKDYIVKNEELTCSLKGNISEYQVSAVSGIIEKSSDYELIEVIPDSSWEGDGIDGDVDLYTDENKKDEFNILEFKILLTDENKKEVKINISNNIYFDENFEEHNIKNIEKVLTVRG